MAARERSPSPKPKKEEPKKEEPKNRLAKLFGTVGKAIKGLTPSDYQESETYGDSLRQYRIPNSAMPTGAKNASEDLLGYKISTQTIGFDGAKYRFQPTATEFVITVEPNKASNKTVVFRDAFKNAAMILSDDERISDKIEEIYRGAHKELQAKPKKEEPKKPVPPRMPRGIADDLIKDYESHEYNRGLGYPLKSITSHIDRLLNEGIFKPKFPHKEYLNSLKKYLNDVAFDATWRGEPQKVVLASDWDAAFKK
jgi:hypothetical protein